MRPMPDRARTLIIVLAALAVSLAAGLLPGGALAAPQIVAAVPSHGEVELVCSGAECAAEFSTICLQRSRSAPVPGVDYAIHRPDWPAVAVTGHRPDGGTMALAAGVLRVASLRDQTAFRFSVPSGFLARHGLARLTVSIGRMAMLVPRPETGDSRPLTADEVAMAVGEIHATGAYWAELNAEPMAMARLTNRVINRLPAKGSVSRRQARALWERAAAPEGSLSGDALDWTRRHVDYCRDSAAGPGRFSMRHCLGTFHDRHMQDLNVKYWQALKPQS